MRTLVTPLVPNSPLTVTVMVDIHASNRLQYVRQEILFT